ncbi:MAG: hypothetical protein RIR11_4764 [Bacteroidota bacterium]|jgi:hypothetical protein
MESRRIAESFGRHFSTVNIDLGAVYSYRFVRQKNNIFSLKKNEKKFGGTKLRRTFVTH